MRIGFDAKVLTYEKTAAAYYLSKLIEFLVRANPRLEIFLFSPDKVCVDYEPYTHFPQVHRVSLDQKKCPGWPQKYLPSLIKEYQIDIFHALASHDLNVFRPGCRSVVTMFDLAPWHMKRASKGFFDEWRYKISHMMWARIADRVITVSDTVKNDVQKYCHLAPQQVLLTPLGAGDGFDYGFSDEEEQQILQKYNLRNKAYVLSVSGLDHTRRNPDYLLDAFAECHRFLPDDLYFVFTGQGYRNEAQYNRTLRKIEMLGIKDKVVITGFIADRVFQVILANAMLSVVTPFYSGVPLAILDSFSYGVPVVASDRGAIPEVVGDAAILVDPYDSSAIAGAIRSLVENHIEHESYAEKALNRAKDFSWEKMAQETLKAYQDILGC